MSGRRLAGIGFADFGTYVEGMTLSGKNTAEGKFLIEGVAGVQRGLEGFYSSMFKEYYLKPAKSDIKSCTVSEFTVSGGKYVGTAVGYSYGTTTVEGFSG